VLSIGCQYTRYGAYRTGGILDPEWHKSVARQLVRCFSFLFRSMSGRRCVSVSFTMFRWLGVVVVFRVAMSIFTVAFVHAFMKRLSLFPGMFTAGSRSDDESSSGKGNEGGLFHEG
jgi:hypothetical protein